MHALCGENGAGKSTLLKILSGVYRADSGAIFIDNEEVRAHSAHEAIANGIAVIYQELHLVPEMTVEENILLGQAPASLGLVDRRRLRERVRAVISEVGVELDPAAKVGTLSLALRQMVEICKAVSRDARVIAFDEPTSSLSSREVERLFELIAKLKAEGKAILYVSHRMDEIFRICDAVTVLRDGRHVQTFESLAGIGPGDVVHSMVGREIEDIFGFRERATGEPILTVDALQAPGLAQPASLQVRAGEIVGIFGLVGAGRTELLRAIYGVEKRTGRVRVASQDVSANPRSSISAGLLLCPEDRKKEGIVPLLGVDENVNLSVRRRYAIPPGLVNRRRERENAQTQVAALGVRTPSLEQPIGLLSGGNQQKAILGRWLSEHVRALMLDEPTRGIDVGAKSEIYDILYGLAEQGVGILLVSSELPEVLGVCDRILVMREGAIVGELSRAEADEVKLLTMALPAVAA